MTGEQDDLFTEMCEEFEAEFLRSHRFWRAPVAALQGTVLYDVYERFAGTFPDHPSDTNTVFYLTEMTRVSPVMRSLILWCDHFEHSGQEDLRQLVAFLDTVTSLVSEYPDSAGVELLDGVRDRLVLSFHEPLTNVAELLQRVGSPGSAA